MTPGREEEMPKGEVGAWADADNMSFLNPKLAALVKKKTALKTAQ